MKDEELDALLGQAPEPMIEGDHLDDAVLLQYVQRRLEREQAAETRGQHPVGRDTYGRDITRPPDSLRQVEKHLATCADCRLLAEGLALEPNPALNAAAAKVVGRRGFPKQILGAMAAIAAAVVLFVWRDPAVPAFEMEGPFGGVQAVRSSTASRDFAADSELEIIFRPESPAPEVSLEARVAINRGAAQESRAGKYERTGDGVLIYRARASELFGNIPGIHTLIFDLSRRGRVIRSFRVEVNYLGGTEKP